MGGCLSSKLIITTSLSHHTHTNDPSLSQLQRQPPPSHPPPTSTHHLLALLRAVNNLPKPGFDLPLIDAKPPPPHHQPCINEDIKSETINVLDLIDDPPSPLDYFVNTATPHNSYGDRQFNLVLGTSSSSSRSFHTVEEYEALLETHHHRLQNSDDNNIIINSQLQNSLVTDSDALEKQVVCMMRESNSKDAIVVVEEEEEEEQQQQGGESKRKRVGKGLGLLQLPPTVTLTLGGQVYSPGLGGSNYVTPKFGSYNVHVPPPTRLEEEDNTNIIDPDLVAAFDECMLQLQLEEDNLIKQIEEGGHPF